MSQQHAAISGCARNGEKMGADADQRRLLFDRSQQRQKLRSPSCVAQALGEVWQQPRGTFDGEQGIEHEAGLGHLFGKFIRVMEESRREIVGMMLRISVLPGLEILLEDGVKHRVVNEISRKTVEK
jgi:hypothetical protein